MFSVNRQKDINEPSSSFSVNHVQFMVGRRVTLDFVVELLPLAAFLSIWGHIQYLHGIDFQLNFKAYYVFFLYLFIHHIHIVYNIILNYIQTLKLFCI